MIWFYFHDHLKANKDIMQAYLLSIFINSLSLDNYYSILYRKSRFPDRTTVAQHSNSSKIRLRTRKGPRVATSLFCNPTHSKYEDDKDIKNSPKKPVSK